MYFIKHNIREKGVKDTSKVFSPEQVEGWSWLWLRWKREHEKRKANGLSEGMLSWKAHLIPKWSYKVMWLKDHQDSEYE